jgi:hypothetical protein
MTSENDARTGVDQVTLALTREEVAALVLQKCKEADFYDWLAEDSQDGDTHDLLHYDAACAYALASQPLAKLGIDRCRPPWVKDR